MHQHGVKTGRAVPWRQRLPWKWIFQVSDYPTNRELRPYDVVSAKIV